jgi:hypothetical protein
MPQEMDNILGDGAARLLPIDIDRNVIDKRGSYNAIKQSAFCTYFIQAQYLAFTRWFGFEAGNHV